MAIQVIFSFDSEDYITPEAADAELWWADLMTRCGVTACICMVGELARTLRDRGRRDTLRAIGRHEVAYHSNAHSAPPAQAVYLEPLPWDAGVAAVLEREASGVHDIAETLGQWPTAYCKPGTSWGPPLAEAMGRMRIPLLCDMPFEWEPGQPLWYANSLCVGYHFGYDDYYGVPDNQRLARMRDDFLRLSEALDGGTLVIWTHPCFLVTSEFWDDANFGRGRDTPRERWQPAPLRTEREVAGLKATIEAFTRWVVSLPQVRLTTYSSLYARCQPAPGQALDRRDVVRLARAVEAVPRPVELDGAWYSPAEIFGLAAAALARYAETGRWPEAVPLRRPIGPVETQPAGRSEAVTLPADALLSTAREADRHVSDSRRLPTAVRAGGAFLGPNSFLQAALRLLQEPGSHQVTVPTTREGVWLAEREDFVNLRFRGSWPIFPPDFEAPRVAELARLQAWSARPARPLRNA